PPLRPSPEVPGWTPGRRRAGRSGAVGCRVAVACRKRGVEGLPRREGAYGVELAHAVVRRPPVAIAPLLKPMCAAHVVAPMPPRLPSPDERLPLRPVEFEILLTLAPGERHGYAIIQETEARSEGAVTLETGTLYRALH